ncbi:MAG: serine hydroxymethyltransferase [Planctomycetota bacterium]|jgi:glycine hydroxymethyltransferase
MAGTHFPLAGKVFVMLEVLLEKLSCGEYHKDLLEILRGSDPEVYELVKAEYERLSSTLQLGAAENRCSHAVLAALGSIIQNKTVEGFAGARSHGGCAVIDEIETLACERAKAAFGAKYANVQPHCGTAANQIVLTAILESGDKILSMAVEHGGHFSHGAEVSFTGKFFDVENYRVDNESYLLDYDAIAEQALKVRPKLIICGASVYPRAIDFKRFREIADSVGAYLLADISHISALVMAGAHESSADYAHFTTSSTYKCGGPRGGLIIMGKDYDRMINVGREDVPLWKLIEGATFPGMQGTPYLNNIAGKAVFFKEALSKEYKERQFKIIENAGHLAGNLSELGYEVLTGGTDNHMILVNMAAFKEGMTGVWVQKGLEQCGIVVDAVEIPYQESGQAAGGVRLGTPIVTKNGMDVKEMEQIAELIDAVLRGTTVISDGEYKIEESFGKQMREKVKGLCENFPLR